MITSVARFVDDNTTHAVCDLVPHSHTASQRPEYMAHKCRELGVLRKPLEPATTLLTCSVNLKPYTSQHFDTSRDGCSICAHSNPDVSKITSPSMNSCLKKPKQGFSSRISLPLMELKSKSDTEWNDAPEAPQTDRILSKMSNDLDFY